MKTLLSLPGCLPGRKKLLLVLAWTLAYPALGQDMPRVRQTIADLTSPQMHGRGYVAQGDKVAATYIRQRFRDLGLQALSPDFHQTFNLKINRFPGRLHLQVGKQQLVAGRDYIAHAASGPGSLSGAVLLVDTLLFSDPAAGARFFRQKINNKVLVLPKKFFGPFQQLPEDWLSKAASAKALLLLVPGKLTASLAGWQAPWPVLEVKQQSWPPDAHKVSMQVDASLDDYPSQNVLAYIPGSVQPDSFLVITAHYDHLGRQGPELLFPGANDNASGTAMLLELAAWYAQPANQPRYSIAFMAFGAEEAGLVGSAYYTQNPVFPLSRIRFLLNLDLLGAGEEGLMVVNGSVFKREFELLTSLNAGNRYVPQIKSRGKAANSDHYHFSEKGVPAFFFYTLGGPKAYHDPDDIAATLPLSRFPQVFSLIKAFFEVI
ncbi:MAG: M28 family metallopeptidase [Adhaeribacter sp.]